jgi:hypothetical protein
MHPIWLKPDLEVISALRPRAKFTIAETKMPNSKSLELFNAPRPLALDTEVMTANVTNISRTDVRSGTVTFQNANDSQMVSFGSIAHGGRSTGSCYLNGLALTCIAHFTGSDGSTWGGIAGDGTEFNSIDVNLNDHK